MGWRFRKSFKVAPSVRLNVSKKGISTSIGPKGAKINIGPSGTRFTASIPGTGLSYTTRLDKPISKSMTQCPYCGHKMRKRWDNCPKCHQPLIKKVEEPQKNASNTEATDNNTTYDTNTNTSNISVADNKNKANNVEPGCYGCGCLVVIIIFILFLIGSCASGTKEDTSPNTTTPTIEETTSQNSSTTDETTENTPNNTTVDTQTTDEQQSTTVEETSTPVAAPSSDESNNTTTATNTSSRKVNYYYGEGPNGETIKGNINSKGEKIYHVPGGAYYDRTDPEAWFFTEEEARAAGYRPSKR